MKRVALIDVVILLYTFICIAVLLLNGGGGNECLPLISLICLVVITSRMEDKEASSILFVARLMGVIYLLGVVLGSLRPELLHSLVSNYRTSELRGAASFASEPSFLGFIGFSLLVIIDNLAKYKKNITDTYIPLLLVFLSGAVSVIGPTLIWLVLNNISVQDKFKFFVRFCFILCIISGGVSYYSETLKNTRAGLIVQQAMDNGLDLVGLDKSLSNRIARGVGPVVFGVNNMLQPQDIEALDEVVESLEISLHRETEIKRISNFSGIFFFILGVIGGPLLAYVFLKSASEAKNSISAFFAVCVLFFSLLSPATPYVHMVIASYSMRMNKSGREFS
ncbi:MULTISPECIES: hypothetical protein [unclassified Oleiphilus]|uniref:hypothetical protein n=1 Tax=unclassified Oleiphilus TaxID=2631174 RepID=UPI0007C320F4|nr:MULTISPECIES: hypothetical protein [unclassified Oleiphilus]KZZ56738.1 hypothetical protein A3761_08140 [Oleiphilus sp. HI0123]